MRVADLFAGWGGFSLGAEQAGANVVMAANHWKLAVDAHQVNHPNAAHACQDLNQANFYDWPDMDLLLAGPACQGHTSCSRPKRRRYHDALRATAWAVVGCADAKEPQAILIENVPEFREWRLYESWKGALCSLGYALEEHVVLASHFGVPQRRKRLIIVATQSKAPMGLVTPRNPEPPFGPCIDWDKGTWRSVETNTANVRGRVAIARARGLGPRFLTQYVTRHAGVPLDEPIRTITTKNQWAIVDGDRMRMLTVAELQRGMGFPDDYRWPVGASKGEQIKGLGNSVPPPLAKWFVEQVAAAA